MTAVIRKHNQGDPDDDRAALSVEHGAGNLETGRFAFWFTQWRRPLRPWLSSRSSVPSADIDDLAQEVFLRLLRYSGDIAVEDPQGHLFRIASNAASEWRERSRQRKPHDDSWLEELQIETSDEPEHAAARSITNKKIRAAVQRLPPRQREVLLLHVNDSLTYKQIADRLGLTYRVVLRDLTRAYSKLRMLLTPEDLKDAEE